MKPLRVLLVEANEDGTVGGSYRCMADLATNIDRETFCPVALFYEANWIADELAQREVDTRTWTRIRSAERPEHARRSWIGSRVRVARAAWLRARFIREEQIALVHLNNSPDFNAFEWVVAAAICRVPIVAHARGPVRRSSRHATSWARSVYRRILAISAHIRANLLESGFPSDKIELVYDGVDSAEVRRSAAAGLASVRRELDVAEGRLLGVMVGNLRSWKGQHVVLEALRQLPVQVLEQIQFVFVGGSSPDDRAYVEQLTRLAAAEPLGGVVRFVGERRDARAIMGASDFVVHASTEPEPFGLVVVEAMALGKPVIASCRGGPLETVAPGCGLLFSPDDPSQLSRLITRLVASPAERRELGVRATARADVFSVERSVRAVEAVYRGVLKLPER